ncbi:mechanosensitive ion channel family protein [Pleionea litopenaei]|uniref:Mechanosensitive ion channel family protein n=1 Tax=Pleionea litopenaei TaxID=3070815 RepID=A0AA51X5K4_9GAMM|nr:mechanosensitive ion channel family protein [Pleionea sp. HL-JVS1]WMS85721.1 mechanosensitive ion channel family protein [Pleionea sp. HL-JVS1]
MSPSELFTLVTGFIVNHKLWSSIILIILVMAVREPIIKGVRKRSKRKGVDRRSTISTIRNLTNFVVFILIFILWSDDIKDFALSIAAFTVAIILATREYVQCLLGFVYLSSTRAFSVGDWIEIDGQYGEVANRDWLKVTLLEVDNQTYTYTGKTLTIPNNRFVTQSVKNLNYLRRYASHTFHITLEPTKNVVPFKAFLVEKAEEYCAPFNDVATRYSMLIEKRLDVSISGPEPDIQITTNELAHIVVAITIFCPTELAVEIEQKLIADFMALWFGDAVLPVTTDVESCEEQL